MNISGLHTYYLKIPLLIEGDECMVMDQASILFLDIFKDINQCPEILFAYDYVVIRKTHYHRCLRDKSAKGFRIAANKLEVRCHLMNALQAANIQGYIAAYCIERVNNGFPGLKSRTFSVVPLYDLLMDGCEAIMSLNKACV